MDSKRIWQSGVVALLVASTAGTVALAANTLSGNAEGVLRQAGALPGDRLASEDESGERKRTEHRTEEEGTGPSGKWIGIDQAIGAVTAAGYRDVQEVERDHGRYEVEARDAEGRKWEIYVDGRTGEIVGRERD